MIIACCLLLVAWSLLFVICSSVSYALNPSCRLSFLVSCLLFIICRLSFTLRLPASNNLQHPSRNHKPRGGIHLLSSSASKKKSVSTRPYQ
ncbi:hypothetical protein BZA77DRAFT_304471 [Pyronema omphalodes]|nr:hypothetical protein BZA77DRAFT_304471 [Pyronema omphalodes]